MNQALAGSVYKPHKNSNKMSFKTYLFLSFAAIFLLGGCLVIDDTYNGLPPGKWRGVVQLEPSYITPNPKGKRLPEKLNLEFEDVTVGELPFQFTVSYPTPDSFVIALHKAGGEIILSDYTIGRDFSTAKDTLTIRFPGTTNYIRGVFEEKILEGHWFYTHPSGEQKSIPVIARQGQDYLFTTLRKTPEADVNGDWNLLVNVDSEQPEPAILSLKAKENELQGTLEWQGRRYEALSGTIQARKLYLSFFDGRDALLLEAKVMENGELYGALASGGSGKMLWQANKNQRNQ